MINMKQMLSYNTEIKVEINHSNGTQAHWREAGMYSECLIEYFNHRTANPAEFLLLQASHSSTLSLPPSENHMCSPPHLQYSPPLIPPRGEVNAADAFDIGSFDEEDTKGIKVRLITTSTLHHEWWLHSPKIHSHLLVYF